MRISLTCRREIYRQIKELARAKGFLKLPWEKQEGEGTDNGNDDSL
jgi:hypothetical protein